MINHLHAKAMCAPLGNALPNAAHAQNAKCAAMNVAASKHVVAPLGPLAGAQKMLAFSHSPCCGHQQRKTKVSGGLRQHVGRIGGLHACGSHGRNVKVVVADRHVGADFQLWASGEHFPINTLATGGENALFAL